MNMASAPRRPTGDPLHRRVALGVFLIALFALRVVYALHLHVNSDEPQHLHVVWAWTQGLLPYRDVFDNHAPLFQFLSAPLLAFIGETPDALLAMRLLVIPWYALALWCTYRIGRVFFGRHVALWAMAIVAMFPDFFLLSVQYRTDDAWAPVWLAMVMVAVEGRPTPRRAFVVGLLAGGAAAISVKSIVLIAAIVLAALATLLLLVLEREPLPRRALARTGAALMAGFIVLPALIAALFALAGAWDAMWYCVFAHNVVPGFERWQTASLRFWLFPLSILPCLALARLLLRDPRSAERGAKRAFVFLAALFYIAILVSYWPLTPRQDWLPFAPFAAIYGVATLRYWHARRRPRLGRAFVYALPLAIETVLLVVAYHPWRDDTQRYRAFVADILRLTDRHDFVMDAKGESVFRERPFYWVLEGITLTRMQLGLITDKVPDRLIATRTAVDVPGRLDAHADAFIATHYVPVSDDIVVAGQRLAATADATRLADVAIATRYTVVDDDGHAVAGFVDGMPIAEGGVDLAAGRHAVTVPAVTGAVTLVWAQAIARGFRPRPPDHGITPADW